MRIPVVAVLLLVALAEQAASQTIVNARIAGAASGLRVGTPVRIAAVGGLHVAGLCDAFGGCRDEYPKAIGVGLALGSGAGALLGAFVGAATHRWRRVYP